eukprot:TRINITY_DN1922_c0_g2_i2.p1 TRINITY_DN1922_c0_g2~~TRINITY_DN1922_c0_g2_i2.p1  ORF type:complete len:371 (+),score=58.12 TRINITY_DN1922_c0_g2_i2:411-1523(+)
METNRSDHTAVLFNDFIVVNGGCVGIESCIDQNCLCTVITNSTEIYYPNTGSWLRINDAPRPRYRHSAAVIGNLVYLFGGRDILDNIITQVDVLNLEGGIPGVWSSNVDWVNATSDLVSFVFNNTIYAVGGYTVDYSTFNTVWTWTPGQSSWVSNVSSPIGQERGDACAAVANGVAYVIGGYSAAIGFCTPLTTFESFDPNTNSWTTLTPIHSRRGDSGCASLHDLFHVIGGEDKFDNCSFLSKSINDVESYDFDTGTWSEETPLPFDRFRFPAITFNQTTLYILGGQGYPYLNDQGQWVIDVYGNVLKYVETTASTTTTGGNSFTTTTTSSSTTGALPSTTSTTLTTSQATLVSTTLCAWLFFLLVFIF